MDSWGLFKDMSWSPYIIGTALILCMVLLVMGHIDKIGRGKDIEYQIISSPV
jgi:hypothetical protein